MNTGNHIDSFKDSIQQRQDSYSFRRLMLDDIQVYIEPQGFNLIWLIQLRYPIALRTKISQRRL